ncbi:MAG: hypothetical protein VW549_04500 [Methylophilaceae bacterium]|jgi:hypothetical protein
MKKITALLSTLLMLGCASAEYKTNNFDAYYGESIEYNIDAMKVPQDNTWTKPGYNEVSAEGAVASTETLKSPVSE